MYLYNRQNASLAVEETGQRRRTILEPKKCAVFHLTEVLAGRLELGHNQKTNKKGHTDYKNLDELLNPAATLSVGVEVARVGAAERSCGEDVGATRTTFPHKKSVFENVLISVCDDKTICVLLLVLK